MSALSIDPDAARRSGAALIDAGDRYLRTAGELRVALDSMGLTVQGFDVRRRLERAAETAWSAATTLNLVVDAAERGDRIDERTVAQLASIAAGLSASLTADNIADRVLGASPMGGDLFGTYDTELRSPYVAFAHDPVERGRQLVIRALADTADGVQIRPDEFQVVQMDDDRYVVVLPGVTDLTHPDLGWSGQHRTVRDIDHAAVTSTWSSSVDHNRYARMVWDALEAIGVPAGAQLAIIGHSYGADTAIDLAADPTFNGERYQVTHVVAAGYHVDDQLAGVPDGTAVLALENSRDVPVIAESIAHSAPVEAGVAVGAAGWDAASGDLSGAAAHAAEAVGHVVSTPLAVGGFLLDRLDEAADLAVGVATNDPSRAIDAVGGMVTLQPQVRIVDGHAIVDVFAGGWAGVGHAQSNYIEHLATTDDPTVTGFLASLDGDGYPGSGSAVAIDVSVPHR